MTTQINQRPQSVLLATIAVIFLLGAFGSTFAQNKGAITEKEIKDFLIYGWTRGCTPEDECTIAFDSAVRIAPAVRHAFQIPPTTYLTYPVKVDYTTHSNRGTFHLNHHTRAVYYFYRNSFGEWEMGMENEETKQEKDEHQEGGTAKAPPTNNQPKAGAQAAKNNQPKTGVKTAKTGDAPAENKDAARDENGQPKIDFSEMEKYFEVVRYEYPTPPANEMFFYLKAKVETGARPQFYIQFRDKDGILVSAQNDYGNGISMTKVFYTAIGETGKASAYIPSEKEMEKVVSAKVVRIKQ